MNVLIFGATGMVGGDVLDQCLANTKIDNVLIVSRRKSGVQHKKLKEILHDNFLDYAALEDELKHTDICYHCLGLYQAHVSKDLFWEITVDYLSALVNTFERVNKNIRMCLMSAQGASSSEKSPIRFAKAKGRAENILLKSNLAKKYIFRPGFILPGPTSKSATFSARLFEPIYRLFPAIGIDAAELAYVMMDVGIHNHKRTLFENRDLRAYRTNPTT